MISWGIRLATLVTSVIAVLLLLSSEIGRERPATEAQRGGLANAQVNNVDGGGPENLVQGETTIVEFDYDDPTDSPDEGEQDIILVAWNDLEPNLAVGYGRSVDGAPFDHTSLFGLGRIALPSPFLTRGDPVLAVDHHAGLDGALVNPRIWLAHMGQPAFQGSNQRTILVTPSDDGGRRFLSFDAIQVGTPPSGTRDDKPWLAIDQRGGVRPPDGNLYVCWTRIGGTSPNSTSQILLAQSTDGATFDPETAITPVRTTPGFVQGCQVTVDIEGHVYVVWVEYLNTTTNTPWLMLRHASPPVNGNAVVFDAPVPVQQLRGGNAGVPGGIVSCGAPNWLPVGPRGNFTYNFVMNLPTLATDPFSGDIYLAWSMWNGPFAANGPSRFDIFYRRGQRPGGPTDWSRRLQVSDDGFGATDEWMPAIATYPLPVFPVPAVGEVGVKIQWYDKRVSGAANNNFEIYAAEKPFTTTDLVSDAGGEPINPPNGRNNCRVADYNGITSGVLNVGSPDGAGPGTYFLHSWSDTRNNANTDPEVYFQSQAFDPGSLIHIPPIFADLKLELFFTQLPNFETEIGAPIRIPFEALITNAGPADATNDTWFTAMAPPELSLRWIGKQGDVCYGSAPPEDSFPGPFTATMGVDCASPEAISSVASEGPIAANGQLGLLRDLEVSCLAEGTFQIEVLGGTGPVLPAEVDDPDLSNNGLATTASVQCLPDPRPPMPNQLSWSGKTKMDWDAIAGATSYRLHRGSGQALRQLADSRFDSCLRLIAQNPESGDVLTENPLPGTLFWYLVSAEASGLESEFGPGRRLESLGDCIACPHVVCVTDGAMSPNCLDPCIAQVCAQDSFCCNNSWDSLCEEQVRTLCGRLECPESSGACSHAACQTGEALVGECDAPPLGNSCVTAVCNADPFCCDPGGVWDELCVSRIPGDCGQSCE